STGAATLEAGRESSHQAFVDRPAVARPVEIGADILVLGKNLNFGSDGVEDPSASLDQSFGIQGGEDFRGIVQLGGKAESAQGRRRITGSNADPHGQNVLVVIG